MKAIAATIPGLEEITIKEIKEILKLSSKTIAPGRILFNVKSEKDIAKFIINTRSSVKVYELLDYSKFKKTDDIENLVKKISFKIKDSFVVRCNRVGNHDFRSKDIEMSVGEMIYKKYKINVDLENPTITIYVDIINDYSFIGMDFTGEPLTKRNYRIKLTPQSINPCLAYSLVRLSDYKKKDVLLNLFSKSGEIAIEAALYLLKKQNKQNFLFNKLIKYEEKEKKLKKKLKIYAIDSQSNFIRNIVINSKIASVYDSIKILKIDTDWLDTKFKKNSVDKIITSIPYPSKNVSENDMINMYRELFSQAHYVLKKTGLMAILTPKPEYVKNNIYKFKLQREIKIQMGDQPFYILIYKKTL